MASDTTIGEKPNTEVVVKDGQVIVGEKPQGEQAYQTSTQHDGAKKDTVFPPFDSSTFGPQLFWLALTFGVLYFLMSKIALPKIGQILEIRRDRIEGDLAEAERLKQKTDQAIESYETELAKSKAKSHEIAEETRNKIKEELTLKRNEVEADLSKKLSIAEASIAQTKAEALKNVDEIATDATIDLVTKLSAKVSAKDARNVVSKILKGA